MVAMTPLITIQVMGLYGNVKRKKLIEKAHFEISQIEDCIIYYDEEEENVNEL